MLGEADDLLQHARLGSLKTDHTNGESRGVPVH
jgi:hypothetical protein